MSFLHVNMVQSPMPSELQNIPKQEPLGTPQNRGRLLHPRQASTEAPPKCRNSRSPRKSAERRGTGGTDLSI